jgi:hypothetical protein
MKYAGPQADEPTDAFWALVDRARERQEECEPLVCAMSRRDLVEFYWTYRDAADLLRDAPWADHASPDLREDGLDDLATFVVAQGRDAYRRVIERPETMPAEAGDFYDILGVVVACYEDRYGEALPFPEDFHDEGDD